MPRERTGTLVYKRTSGWNARIWVDVCDEAGNVTQERRWFPLETHDKDLAKRKLDKIVGMIARGELVADAAPAEATRVETYAEYEDAFFDRRRAHGIRTVDDEVGVSKRQIRTHLAHLPLTEIRAANVRAVLTAAIADGLKRNSVRTVRAVMNRTLRAAWEDELISENPVAKVRIPRMNEIRRARVILTDDEIAAFMASPRVPTEIKVLSLTARTEGGMRTGDLTSWRWSMISIPAFDRCVIPRAKKGQPQALEIPAVLRPFLRAWWAEHGSPADGPVFPTRRGKRAGEARKARGVSFAGALRKGLLRAGVVRHDCDGSCSREKSPEPCPNFASDPLFNDTTTTQRVDFHSFRRAFNTALAEAGVNVQQAMHLAGHSDPKVHAMYVMSTKRMQHIPEAALPTLALPERVTAVTESAEASAPNSTDPLFSRSHLRGLNSRPTVYETVALPLS